MGDWLENYDQSAVRQTYLMNYMVHHCSDVERQRYRLLVAKEDIN